MMLKQENKMLSLIGIECKLSNAIFFKNSKGVF
jgi:hypothetical protein